MHKRAQSLFLESAAESQRKNLTALNQGQAIGRLIKLGDDNDIAIMGAVRLNVPMETYLDRYRPGGEP